MSSWKIIEWDLANPLLEALGPNCIFANIALGNEPRPNAITLRELGRRVEGQLPFMTRMQANRGTAKFLWLDVRMTLGDERGSLDKALVDQIRQDPLLHQRLFDAVQAEFRLACLDIARMLRFYDPQLKPVSRVFGPGFAHQDPVELTLLVDNIRNRLSWARDSGVEKLLAILKETLPRELAGKRSGSDKVKAGIMIGLGVAGVICGAAGTAIAILSGGAAVPFLAAGIYAGGRGFLDLLKSLSDEFIGVERLRKRIVAALAAFKQSKGTQGAKRTAEVLANCFVKSGAIGFNLFGNSNFASLSDLYEAIKLYEEKLCSLRAKAHDLSRELGVIIDRKIANPHLEKLLRDIPELHVKCDSNLAALPPLKSAVQEVIQSQGKRFVQLEKWLDFTLNVALTGLGTFVTVSGAIEGATNALERAGIAAGFTGTAIDGVSETAQLFSNASSRYERG